MPLEEPQTEVHLKNGISFSHLPNAERKKEKKNHFRFISFSTLLWFFSLILRFFLFLFPKDIWHLSRRFLIWNLFFFFFFSQNPFHFFSKIVKEKPFFLFLMLCIFFHYLLCVFNKPSSSFVFLMLPIFHYPVSDFWNDFLLFLFFNFQRILWRFCCNCALGHARMRW